MAPKPAPRPFFAWRQRLLISSLPPTTRHVLLTLGCHMDDQGASCWPSIALLAAETGLSRQTVVEHLKRAREDGWVVVRKHGALGRRWKRSDYVIAFPPGADVVKLDAVKHVDHLKPEAVKHVDHLSTENPRQVDLSISKTTHQGKEVHHVGAPALAFMVRLLQTLRFKAKSAGREKP